MGEVEILLDEFEENLYHPAYSIGFKHLYGRNAINVSQKIDYACRRVDHIAFGIYGVFVEGDLDMAVNGGIGHGGRGAEYAHLVELVEDNAAGAVNPVLSDVAVKLLNHISLSPSLVGNPD